ncbi:MAG: L-seryl-tRNA(Sec) selenium transferase [Phycisphaerae bacterium]|nr:L-seryl-tRNA(Sec) selenium transferase [Phycisphaerae bacterium]
MSDMSKDLKADLLRKIPSVSDLLGEAPVARWLRRHPRALVTDCLRAAADELRQAILNDTAGHCGSAHVTGEAVLARAEAILADRTTPQLRGAINATGIILHTGLGRAIWPEGVVDSMVEELKGYVTLAVDRSSGLRSDRDGRVEGILQELTGAEAATVVNNNAAATLLVLAALAAGREVIVSRGQLIEIGGSFRLPEVMAASTAQLVEVGTTNRTHLRDYAAAITDRTAMLMRVHPSNFRVVGFTAEVALSELAELAHSRGLIVLDDLGAGALVDLEQFGLPHEPTARESLTAGADVVIFSADKLIGASQGGIILGRADLIEPIRRHPLARAMRADKTCLMALERTAMLFRDPVTLPQTHPTYRMLTTPLEKLQARAAALVKAIGKAAPKASATVGEGTAYLGSGSLPMHALPSRVVAVTAPGVPAEELARRLRMDKSAVFARVENQALVLDVRTLTDDQVAPVAEAIGRAAP